MRSGSRGCQLGWIEKECGIAYQGRSGLIALLREVTLDIDGLPIEVHGNQPGSAKGLRGVQVKIM
jgi:hypothetical protein